MNVAAADLDGDGNAEIVAATGQGSAGAELSDDARSKGGSQPGSKKDGKEKEAEYSDADEQRGVVRIFSASGALLNTLVPFEDAKDGISVAVGDLGL